MNEQIKVSMIADNESIKMVSKTLSDAFEKAETAGQKSFIRGIQGSWDQVISTINKDIVGKINWNQPITDIILQAKEYQSISDNSGGKYFNELFKEKFQYIVEFAHQIDELNKMLLKLQIPGNLVSSLSSKNINEILQNDAKKRENVQEFLTTKTNEKGKETVDLSDIVKNEIKRRLNKSTNGNINLRGIIREYISEDKNDENYENSKAYRDNIIEAEKKGNDLKQFADSKGAKGSAELKKSYFQYTQLYSTLINKLKKNGLINELGDFNWDIFAKGKDFTSFNSNEFKSFITEYQNAYRIATRALWLQEEIGKLENKLRIKDENKKQFNLQFGEKNNDLESKFVQEAQNSVLNIVKGHQDNFDDDLLELLTKEITEGTKKAADQASKFSEKATEKVSKNRAKRNKKNGISDQGNNGSENGSVEELGGSVRSGTSESNGGGKSNHDGNQSTGDVHIDGDVHVDGKVISGESKHEDTSSDENSGVGKDKPSSNENGSQIDGDVTVNGNINANGEINNNGSKMDENPKSQTDTHPNNDGNDSQINGNVNITGDVQISGNVNVGGNFQHNDRNNGNLSPSTQTPPKNPIPPNTPTPPSNPTPPNNSDDDGSGNINVDKLVSEFISKLNEKLGEIPVKIIPDVNPKDFLGDIQKKITPPNDSVKIVVNPNVKAEKFIDDIQSAINSKSVQITVKGNYNGEITNEVKNNPNSSFHQKNDEISTGDESGQGSIQDTQGTKSKFLVVHNDNRNNNFEDIQKYLVSIEEASEKIKELQIEIDKLQDATSKDASILNNEKQADQLKYFSRILALKESNGISDQKIIDILGKNKDGDIIYDLLGGIYGDVKDGIYQLSDGLVDTLDSIMQHSKQKSDNSGENVNIKPNMDKFIKNIKDVLSKQEFDVTIKPDSGKLITSINEILKNNNFNFTLIPNDVESNETTPSNLETLLDSLATKVSEAVKDGLKESGKSGGGRKKQDDYIVEQMNDADKTRMILDAESFVKKQINDNKNFQLVSTKNTYRPDSEDLEAMVIKYIERQANGAIIQASKKLTVEPAASYDEEGNLRVNEDGKSIYTYQLKEQDTLVEKFKDINAYVDNLVRNHKSALNEYFKADKDIYLNGDNSEATSTKHANALQQMKDIEAEILNIQSNEVNKYDIHNKLLQSRKDVEEQTNQLVNEKKEQEELDRINQTIQDVIDSWKKLHEVKINALNPKNELDAVALKKAELDAQADYDAKNKAYANLVAEGKVSDEQKDIVNSEKLKAVSDYTIAKKSNDEAQYQKELKETQAIITELIKTYKELQQIRESLLKEDSLILRDDEARAAEKLEQLEAKYQSRVESNLVTDDQKVKVSEVKNNAMSSFAREEEIKEETQYQNKLKETQTIVNKLIEAYVKLWAIKTKRLTKDSSALINDEKNAEAEYQALEAQYQDRVKDGKYITEAQKNSVTEAKSKVMEAYSTREDDQQIIQNENRAKKITEELTNAYKELYDAKIKALKNPEKESAKFALTQKGTLFNSVLTRFKDADRNGLITEDQKRAVSDARTLAETKYREAQEEQENLKKARELVEKLIQAYEDLHKAKIEALKNPGEQATKALEKEEQNVKAVTEEYTKAKDDGLISDKQNKKVNSAKKNLDRYYTAAVNKKAAQEKKDAKTVQDAIDLVIKKYKELLAIQVKIHEQGLTNELKAERDAVGAEYNKARDAYTNLKTSGHMVTAENEADYRTRKERAKRQAKIQMNSLDSKKNYDAIKDDVSSYMSLVRAIAQGSDDSKGTIKEIADTLLERIEQQLLSSIDSSQFNQKRYDEIQTKLGKAEGIKTIAEAKNTAKMNNAIDVSQIFGAKSATAYASKYNTLLKGQERYLQLQQKLADRTITASETDKLKTMQKEITETLDALTKLHVTFDALGEDGKVLKDDDGNNVQVSVVQKQNKGLVEARDNLQKITTKKLVSELDDLKNHIESFTTEGEADFQALEDEIKNLKLPELKVVGPNEELGYIYKEVEDFVDQIKSIRTRKNDLRLDKTRHGAKQDEVASMTANYYSQKSRNSKAVEARPEAFKNIEDQLSKSFNMSQVEADKLDVKIKLLEADASKAGNTGSSFLTEVGNRFKSLISYAASFVSVYQLMGQLRQGVNIVQQYDSAMTEMKKVTSGTNDELKAYAATTGVTADAIGTSAVTLQNSAADQMRLGYSIKDAGELAKNTATLMNVSEFDNISTATESMVALVQAFKDANTDAGELSADIIDKLNNIGNNYSISTSELAESLKRSSGTLIAAGNDIDKAIALTTAGNAIIQDPESVGNALKVISMRLRGTTAKELEDQGEDSTGLIETTSKLESQIKSLTAINGKAGVSITDLNGNYRDTYDILQDIADIWDQIGEADKSDGQNRQAALLETMAGKTRAQALASILQNGDMLRSVYEDSQESAGSAQHENETYMESIAAHQQQLTNAYQEMWSKAINRDVINFFLDLGKGTTNLISKVGLLKVALVGLAATLNGIFTKTGSGLFKVEYDNNGNAKSVFNKDNILSSIVRGYKDKPKTYGFVDEKEFNNANKKSLAKLNKEDYEKDSDLQKMREYYHQVGANKGNYEEYKEYIKQANIDTQKFKLSTIGAKIATQAFGLAVSAVGTALASQAIGKIIKSLDDFIHYDERVAEASKEAQSALDDQVTTFKETKDSADDAFESYKSFMNGVDENGNNVSLTTDEYNKFLDVNNQLAQLFPSLERTYDSNGNAIVNLGNNVDEATEKYNALLDAQKNVANQEILKNLPDIWENTVYQNKKYQNEIDYYRPLVNSKNEQLEKYQNNSVTDQILDIFDESKGHHDVRVSEDEYTKIKSVLNKMGLIEGQDYNSYIDYDEGVFTQSLNTFKSEKVKNLAKDKLDAVTQEVYGTINKEITDTQGSLQRNLNEQKQNWVEWENQLVKAYSFDPTYSTLSGDAQKLFQDMIHNTDQEELNKEGYSDPKKWIDENILNLFADPNNSNKINSMIQSKSGISTGETSIKEYKEQYEDFAKEFKDSNAWETLKNVFGEDATPQLKNYNKLLEDIKQSFIDSGDQADIAEKEAQSMVDQLSNIGLATITTREDAGELFRTFAQGSDSVTEAWQKVYDYIKTTPEGIQAEIDKISSNASGWSEGMNSFWTAINEQNSNGAVSTESYNSMISAMKSMGISAEDMFSIFHNGYAGLQLDTDKFWSLISKSSDEMVTSLDKQRSSLSNNLDRYQGELFLLEGLQDSVKEGLMSETDAINKYSRGVTNNTDLIGINKKSLDELVEAKRKDVETTRKQYAEIQNAIDKYDASYNAYNLLQSAISSSNAGAHYDTVQGQKDQIEKLVKGHQWGTDDVEQQITYWTGRNGAELNHDQKVEAYKTAKKNATTYSTDNYKGVEAFYNKLTTLKKGVTYDANTDTLQIDSIRDAANEANVSVSALVDILNKMKDYDIDVNFSETEVNATKAEDKVNALQKKLDELQYQRTLTIAANKDADTKELDSEIANLQQQLNNTKLEVTLFTNNDKVLEDLENYKKIIKDYKKELDELNDGKGVKQGEDYVLDENGKVDFKNSKNREAANIVNNMMNNMKLAKARGLKSGITEEAVSTLIKVDGVDEATGNLASVQDKFDETKKKVETPLVPTVNIQPLDASFAKIQESQEKLRTYFKENPLPISPAASSYAARNDGSKTPSNEKSQAHGTARAQGTWGNKHPGKTLVGELGPELVVRGSEYFTVGDNGAEMVDLKKDDIVFNHEQTAGILNNRKINSRGEALAQGKNQELLVGNVDIANRPIVQLGDGSYATSLTSFQEKQKDDHYIIGHFAQILQNGTILDDATFIQYMDKVLSSDDPFKTDALEYSILYKIDEFVNNQKITNANLAEAFKQADAWDVWMHEYQDSIYGSAAKSGKAFANGQNNDLVGELGPELRIRGNEYTLLGQHGAEFTDIRPDDIILNAEQTANALSGKAYVHGKAYANVNAATHDGASASGGKKMFGSYNAEEAKTAETEKQLKNEKAKTEASKEEYFQEDRALDTVKKKNDKIRTAFEDTFKSYEEREQSFQELIINDQKVIETAMERLNRKQDTYNMRYTEAQQYFSADQLEKIVSDIKNGNLTPNNTAGASWDDYYDIFYGPENTKNEKASKLYEKQKEAITNLMNAYDDQVSAEEDIVNAEKQMQQDRAAAYELDMSKIEEAIDEFQDKIDSIQTDIEIKGTTGKIVGAQDYMDLISASQDAQSSMEDKLARAEERLAELSPDSEEYWNVKKTISETTAAIKQADSQQAEWNETIKDLPITHLQTYIDNLNTIQKDLDNMTSEIEAKGQRVTEDLIKKQIDLQSMIAQQYKQQIDLVEDKLNNRGYTPGSDKWNETFQQLQDIDDSLSGIVTQIINFNKQLLQIPVDKLSDVNTEIQNIQSGLTSKQNDNTTVIQGYIAILQKANDDLTESYEDQIKPLQQQLDALNAQNEARQRQLNIEQAQYNLEKAREQKTVQVVRNGRLVYTADQDNVRNAENELAQANYDKMKGELQDKIDALEKDRDEKSEALTDAQNRQQKIQSDSETNINVSNAAELAKMSPEKLQQIAIAEAEREKLKNQHLGEKGYDVNKDLTDAQKELLAEADKLYSNTKKDYEQTAEQINSTDKIQSSLDTIVTLLTRINELYIKEAITAEEAKKMTQDVINSGKDGLTGLEHSNLVNEIEKKDSINDAINKAKDAISETTNGIDNLYKQTEANNVIINAYSKDKNALDAEIKKELEKSADAYANLKASEALGYTDKNAYGNGDYVGRGDSKGDTFTNGTDFAYSWFTEARASGLDTEKSKDGVDYYKNGTKVTRGSNGSLYIDTANGWATAISAAQIQKYGLDTARESNDAAANQKTASELLKESAGALNNAAGNIASSSSKQDKILESHDGNYKNSGNGYTISQDSSGHKTITINYGNGIVKKYGMASGVIKRAGGIKEGAIPGFHGADSNDARTRILQEMSMHSWKPSEIPIIADEGEVVFNKAQQNTMIQNMRSALTPVSLPNLDKNVPGASIHISMGDLTLPNVTDGKSFATAIQQQFEPAMNQYFSKVFRK